MSKPPFLSKATYPRWVLTVIALIFNSVLLPAQYQMEQEHLTVDLGLSENLVTAFLQDSKGFLWIGTSDGLNKYDGLSTQIFYANDGDPLSLSSNSITQLLEDKNGFIWIGTNNGINKYDRVNGKFEQYTFTADSSALGTVRSLLYHKNEVFVGSNIGILKYSPTTNQFFRWSFESEFDPPFYLSSSSDSTILAYSADKKIYEFDSRGNRIKTYPNLPLINPITKPLWESLNHGMLALADSSQVHIYSLKEERVVRSEKFDSPVRSFHFTGPNELWLATENFELYQWINPISADPKVFTYDKETNPSRISPPRTMYRSKENVLWIGTNGKGVSRLIPETSNFKLLSSDSPLPNTLINESIRSLMFLDENRLLIGGYTGIELFDVKNRVRSTLNLRGPNFGPVPYSMSKDLSDSNFVWIGSEGQGLFRMSILDGSFNQFKESEEYSKNFIQSLFPVNRDTLLLGTNSGLSLFDASKHEFISFAGQEKLSHISITAIQKISSSTFWLGTKSNGIIPIEIKKGKISLLSKFGPSGMFVLDISPGNDGSFWVGTQRGLFTFSANSTQLQHFTVSSGLSNATVYTAKEDVFGNVWMSTNNGINRYNINNSTFTTYDYGDGLQSKEFNRNAHASYNGEIIALGGINGVNYFDVENAPRDSIFHPVYVYSVDANNTTLIEEKSGDIPGNFEFHAFDRQFTIPISSPIFLNPNETSFYYRVLGYSEKWISVGNADRIDFINMPAGDYELQVVRSSRAIVDTAPKTTLTFSVVAPFYMNISFYIVLILFLIVGGLGAFNIRISRLEKERNQQREYTTHLLYTLDEERKRVSNALHDSVGTQLMLIKRFTKKLMRTIPNSFEESKDLEHLLEDTIRDVREISHNLHPHLLDKLGLTKSVESLLRSLEKVAPFEMSINISHIDSYFSNDESLIMYRLIQETLTNAVRHSQATLVTIDLVADNKKGIYRISDNGQGFLFDQNSISDKQTGIQTMKERVEMIGGVISIESDLGLGTVIEVIKTKN